MSKLKVAVLEDKEDMLKELIINLKETNLVEVVSYPTNSTEFLKQIDSSVEALILDIEIDNDMSGIEVANKLKLPVLFVSGRARDYLSEIEYLNANFTVPVEHVMKFSSLDKLTKILQKFINQIRSTEKMNYVTLDFKESKNQKICIDSIVYIETDTGNSGKSNNKRIYFKDRLPMTLIDFSFKRMEERGLTEFYFARPSQSHRVNKNHVEKYNKDKNSLEVKAMNNNGNIVSFQISVSENYRTEMKNMFR